MAPKSRAEAKALGDKFYFTGKPCKQGHVSPRLTSNAGCYECHKAKVIQWQVENKDKYLTYRRENLSDWRRNGNFKEWNRQYAAFRRALKLSATPPWADKLQIRRIYEECPPGHHVDHIIPLKGDTVCGLHVETNLQHIPDVENLRKGNRLMEEYYGE